MGIVESDTEKLAGEVFQQNDVACLRLTGDGMDFITECPEVSADDPVVFLFFQRDNFFHTLIDQNFFEDNWRHYSRVKRSRKLFDITDTELNAIAPAAITGFRNPRAASGIPTML